MLYKYEHTATLKPWETVGEAEHTRLSRKHRKPRYETMLRKLTATVLPHCAVTVLLLVAFFFLSFLSLLPCTKWIMVKLMQMIATITLPTEVYWHSLFTWSMLKSLRNVILLELQKSARIDHPAPNPSLISMDGLSHCRLFNFCKGNRPLIVNFCSWTCPVFRTRVGEFLSIVQEFSDVADFLTVYIDEAHPSNGWAFKVSSKLCEFLAQRSVLFFRYFSLNITRLPTLQRHSQSFQYTAPKEIKLVTRGMFPVISREHQTLLNQRY